MLPSDELRGLTKLIKITEEVRKFAAEQGISDDAAVQTVMEQKAKEFAKAGAEIYSKA